MKTDNAGMSEFKIRLYQGTDESAVVALWRTCGLVVPWNDPHADIAMKLDYQPDLFFVGTVDGAVVATAMVGYEGHRGWINYLAVAPEWQGHGYGRQMVEFAEEKLRDLGCPKINLHVRNSNTRVLAFYERLGFRRDESVCLGKRLGSGQTPTPWPPPSQAKEGEPEG